jgi:glyoxylase-like metal-dependent hydrolase (beta-lactamase superfamily II)
MAEIKIIIEGYAKKLENGWVAQSTTCLVTSDDNKIITDPGCNRALLLEAMKKENLSTADIDFVVLSHQHPDHILLAGIFENAKFITFDAGMIYDGDSLTEYNSHELGEDIEIVQTPGHVLEHISLVVTTKEGKIGIAGDVIWWLQDEEQKFDLHQYDHSQAKGMDMEALVGSRKKLISMSDFIIPGHGKMFKVQK